MAEQRTNANEANQQELGYASLARRITGWGSRLILTGLVLVLGVTFGRQVLLWWGHRGDSVIGSTRVQVKSIGADLGQPYIPQWIQFGQSPVMVQTFRIQGDRKRVLANLVNSARQVLSTSQPLQTKPGPKETQILAWIVQKEPVVESTEGRLYQSIGPLPMVVAVKPNEDKAIAAKFRVVSWGIGLPSNSAESEWMLCTYSAHRKPLQVAGKAFPDLPQLADSRKILTLRSPSGSGMMVLAGRDSLENWKGQIQRQMMSLQWEQVEPWRELGEVWLTQYRSGTKQRLVIQLATSGSAETQAIFTIVSEQDN